MNIQSIYQNKIRKYLLKNLYLLLLLSFNFLYSNEPEIKPTFFTSKEIETHTNPDIRSYTTLEPGHSKTFLFIKNFPINKKFTLSTKRLVQIEKAYKKVGDFCIDAEGLIIADSKASCHFFCVSSRGFLPGERIHCQFIGDDFEIKTSCIPNPLLVQLGTSAIEAELITFKPAMYQFKFIGFQEDEVLEFLSISGKEKMKHSIKVSKDQGLAYSPDVIGSKGGTGKVIFKRQSGEQMQIKLPWGAELVEIYRRAHEE